KDLLERAFGVPLPGLTEELHGADVSALLLEHAGLHGVRRDGARRLPALLLRALDERVVHGLRDRLAPARERLRAGADVVLGERTDAHREELHELAAVVLVRVLSSRRSQIQVRSEEHTSELQSRFDLVCRL